MQPSQVDKIKNLIKNSNLLNDQERVEWGNLLLLMNDKQILELEKILTQDRPVKAAPLASAVFPIRPVTPVPANNSSLHLDHIMNMPKPWSGAAATKPPIPEEKKPVVTPANLIKNLQHPAPLKDLATRSPLTPPQKTFAQKLKGVFRGKQPPVIKPLSQLELTTSKPEFPLEISAPQIPKPAPLPVMSKPAEIKKPLSGIKNLPKFYPAMPSLAKKSGPLPQPVFIPPVPPAPRAHVPPPALPRTEAKTPPVSLKNILKDNPPTTSPSYSSLSDIDKKLSPDAVIPKTFSFNAKKPESFTPGLAKMPVNLQYHLESPPPPELKENAAPTDLNFQDITELAKIDLGDFRKADLKDMAEKVKKLRHKYGYHDVVFNLEQSPAFKAYLDTGTQLLSKQTSFGELLTEKGSKYLSKEEFEKFADLLRMIQAE